MARQMTPAERAARDALAPYVKARHMTQHEANQTITRGLALAETTVRDHLANGFGSLFYYGRKVTEAERDYHAATNAIVRRMKRTRLLATEIYLALYKAVRAEYKTPGEITAEDREAPLFAAAPEIVTEEAAAATDRSQRRVLTPAA